MKIKNFFPILIKKGYETTSTGLSYSAYVLSKYPQEQQKLYDEIVYAMENNPKKVKHRSVN